MTRYTWSGPQTTLEIWPIPSEGEPAAAPLVSLGVCPGRPVDADLPADHPHVETLVARGLLVAAAPAPTADPAESRKRKDSSNG